jgi:hypothetical protein
MGLGSDRPDNAQLLAQSGPRWLGAQDIDGRHYDIFSGPHPQPQKGDADPGGLSPLTYWIDASGNLGSDSRIGLLLNIAVDGRNRVHGRSVVRRVHSRDRRSAEQAPRPDAIGRARPIPLLHPGGRNSGGAAGIVRWVRFVRLE